MQRPKPSSGSGYCAAGIQTHLTYFQLPLGGRKILLSRFFPWEVALPPLFFCKKISGIGGSPPHNRKSANFIWEKITLKGLKLCF